MAGIRFLTDVTTQEPIQFQNSSGTDAGKIAMDGDDLVISNAVGNVLFGDATGDVYIGDGVNSVDLLFDQNGSIKGEDGGTVTLTLGSSDTTLNVYNPQIGNGMTLTSTMTIGTGGSIDFTPDSGALLKFDGQTILERRDAGGALTLGHDNAVIIAGGDTSGVLNTNHTSTNETVAIGAEQGVRIYSWTDNDTTWSNREQWLFTDKMYFGTSTDTNLYRSASNTLKTDDSFVVGSRLYITTRDTNTTSTTALVMNGTEVEQRTLGSNAFNSTTIPTNNNQLTNGAGYVTSSGNTVIGTDSDLNTSGSTIIDNIFVTDGVITSMGTRTLAPVDIGAATSSHNHDGVYFKYNSENSGFLNLAQNTVGTTYGDTVSTVPSYYFGQKVGDNDGWRLYGEAPASNDVKMIFEIIDDIESGDTWVFRNKKTYSPFTANDVVIIGGEGNIYTEGQITLDGRLRIGTVDANTTSTTALVLNGTEVEKRTLGSNAFNSTTIPTGTLASLNSINNSNWSGTDLSIENGGTGASTASAARTNLGLGSAATSDTGDFATSSHSHSISTGHSGAITAGGSSGTIFSLDSRDTRNNNQEPDDYNHGVVFDFKGNSTTGLSDGGTYHGLMHWRSYGNGTDLSGGYPAQIAYTANGNLWMRLGTSATAWGSWVRFLKTTDSVSDLGTINNSNWSGTDLSVANGGTGASTAAAARTNLGLGTAATSDTGDFAAASHNQAWSTITGTPTTLAGYGITDSVGEDNVQSDWNATSGDALILNKPTLFSGDYNDLTNPPTIPSGNAIIDWTVDQGSTNIHSGNYTNTVYTHPTFNGDDFSIDTGALTGATVISDLDINITTNGEGHVTDANGSVSTRTLTLADLGYTGATNANNYSLPVAGSSIGGVKSGTDISVDASGNVSVNNDSHTHDGRYYTESEIQTFLNRGYISNHTDSGIAAGWYTIATNTGNRAIARFALRDTDGGDHQSVVFYAAHHYGQDASNTITVLHNSHYSGSPYRYIRIKDGGTYDGAALQVYIDKGDNNLMVAILGDNFQSDGWVLKDFIADATDPGDLSNYSSFGVRGQVDLDNAAQGGMITTGNIYAGGDTTQYRVLTTNDEGSGNGLDADTLDGNHSSAFAAASHTQAWSTITSTPTTIAGYAITDAFSGDYDDLTNKPTISTPAITSDGATPSLNTGITGAEIRTLIGAGTSNLALGTTASTALAGNTAVGDSNVQSDWNATTGDAFIQNKPTIPSGNAVIDWTVDQGSTNIHSDNYTNTTYSVGDGGLTQKNFTTTLKTKLDGIASGAEVNVQSDWNATSGDALILNKPTLGTAASSAATDFVAVTGDTMTSELAIVNNVSTNQWLLKVSNNNGTNNSGFYTTNSDVRLLLRDDAGNIRVDLYPDSTSRFYDKLQVDSDFLVASKIVHTGDTDTYMQFHAADQWRVVTGGSERLEVNNTQVTVQNNFVAVGTVRLQSLTNGLLKADSNGDLTTTTATALTQSGIYSPKGWKLTGSTYTGGGQNITSSSTASHSGTTPVTRTNNTTFTINETGYYEIRYQFLAKNNYANRCVVGAQVTDSGNNTLLGSRNFDYLRYTTYGEYASIQATFYATIDSGATVFLKTAIRSGSLNYTLDSETGANAGHISFRLIKEI